MPRFAKRDELETRQRCFLDPRSFVSRGGEDFLFGEDMSVRRHEAFERSDGFCDRAGCNRPISEESFHLHHKKTRGKGGSDNLSDLMALCMRCHKFFHREREPQFGASRKAEG